jgi:hypothetical protein
MTGLCEYGTALRTAKRANGSHMRIIRAGRKLPQGFARRTPPLPSNAGTKPRQCAATFSASTRISSVSRAFSAENSGAVLIV